MMSFNFKHVFLANADTHLQKMSNLYAEWVEMQKNTNIAIERVFEQKRQYENAREYLERLKNEKPPNNEDLKSQEKHIKIIIDKWVLAMQDVLNCQKKLQSLAVQSMNLSQRYVLLSKL